MVEVPKPILIKLLLLGDSGSGKTSLMLRYVENAYQENPLASIGIDFKIKTVDLLDKKYKLQIWDTAGQERFRTITTSYYKAAKGIILTCDLSSENSLTNADFWLAQIKAHAPQASIILVGTKSDKEQIFPIDIMRQFASERDINYIATSSKEGTNVNEAFLRLLKEIIMLAPDEMEEKKVDNLVIHEDKNRKGACC